MRALYRFLGSMAVLVGSALACTKPTPPPPPPETADEAGAAVNTAPAIDGKAIIAGAGGAAHLPGMVAALTELPVLGVPVQSRMLSGVDSLLSIVQMPAGVPTATFSIGPAGATNAALFAIRMLALDDAALRKKLSHHRDAAALKSTRSTADLRPARVARRRR